MQDSRFTRRFDKDHPAPFEPGFASRQAWLERAAFLRRQARVALGLHPMPTRGPIEPLIHGRIELDGYSVEKIRFTSFPGVHVCGNLYRPLPADPARRRPAVLTPHGHWRGGRFMWRSEEEIEREIASGAERARDAARSPLQARCVTLARLGCVVLHYDMAGYADTLPEHARGFESIDDVLHLRSFMGLQTFISIRALDCLLSLPDVDPDRVAVTGASSGATQAIALLAVDDRPAATCPVVMVSMNMQGGCACENAPLYRVFTNNVELACLAAPRPQEVVAADDWTSDFETRGLPEMKRVYALLGAADRIDGKHLRYPHNYNVHSRERMYAFISRAFGLGHEGKDWERPFEPLAPAQLTVFDAEHPRPAEEPDAGKIATWWTRDAASQLERLRPDADAYRAMLHEALSAMLVDRLTGSAGEVEVVGQPPLPAWHAGAGWSGQLSRRDAGERVPVRLELPARWNGAVVVFSHERATALVRDQQVVSSLLDARLGVLAVDLFCAGEFVPESPVTRPTDRRYLGFTLGYNRAVIAERAHDVLTAIGWLRSQPGVRAIRVLGGGIAGPPALLAAALAGDVLSGSAIDLDGFDFHDVATDDDPRLLPGGLKYGGLAAFASLCRGPALIAGLSERSDLHALRASDGVVVQHDRAGLSELVEFLLEP